MDKTKNYEKPKKVKEEQKKNPTKLDKESEKVKSELEMPYDVRLNDIWGTTSKEIIEFPVKRYIEGANVYLINEKRGFKEYMPIDDDDYKNYSLEVLEKEIKTIQSQMDNKAKNRANENPRSLKSRMRLLKNRKRSLEIQGRGSYMRFAQSGRPFFEFDRVGNFKVPVFKNVDYSTLGVPSETRIKTTSELLLENDEKNGDKSVMPQIFMGVILFLTVVAFCASLFTYYKSSQLPDVCSENLDKASIVFGGVVQKMDQVVTNMENISESVQLKPKEVDVVPVTTEVK